MGDAISSIFTGIAGIFGGEKQPQEQIQAPSAEETTAQKETTELLTAQEKVAASEREARQRVVTARAAGPATLFKREGEIPRAVKLGGGRRA